MANLMQYVKLVALFILSWVLLPALVPVLLVLASIKDALGPLPSLIIRRKKPLVVRTPEERFRGLENLGYTFNPNYVDLPIGGGKTLPRVHYVDEGPREAKETILCLHGEPSWSFLYRTVVPGLVKAGHRVVVPDFIGFGKSDKFVDMESYSHELHTMTLRLLLEHLKLKNITLVCQDWGGLTGLAVVKDMPDVFSRLVLMNTGLPCGAEFSLSTIRLSIPFLLWRGFAQLVGTMMPMYYIFKYSLIKPSKSILQAYTAPFPSKLYKAAAAKWPLLVPLSSHTPVAVDMKHTQDFLAGNWKKPVLIMFSDKDPITRGQDKIFLRLLPHAATKTVVGGGHFLQEDKGEELATHISSFIDGKF